MRFCEIKIIFLISALLCFVQASTAKEYDFSFDVYKPKASHKRRVINSAPLPSTSSWRIGMQASLLPDFLEGSGELLYGNFGNNNNKESTNWDNYLLKLGVNGKRNIFGYGFNFYSVGKQYEGKFNSKYSKKKGRAGYDSWVSLNIEKLQVKTKYLESWSNDSSNEIYTHTFDSWHEIETSYPITSDPLTEISIAYGVGERQRFTAPDDIQSYQGSLDLYKTKFRFVDDYLEFSTEAKKSSTTNDLDNNKDFEQEMLYYTSTLFPNRLFSIISSYRYSIDSHSSRTYKSKLNKMESSLGLIYKSITVPASLKLTSGYNNLRSDDGLTHRDIVNFGAQLDWKSKEPYTGFRSDWTLNVRYKDTVDYKNPTTSSSGLSLNLLWQWPIS